MIKKNLLKIVLSDQYENISIENTVQREALGKIKKFAKLKQIIVITGPRRSGKSTFLFQIMKEQYKKGNYYYINFDDDRLSRFNIDDFQLLLETFHSMYGNSKTIFLDEIQNIDKWELFIARLYNANYKIYLTGSNAKLLSSELSTHLTGRHIDLNIFPFSFIELLRMNNIVPSKTDINKTSIRGNIDRVFQDYVKYGGFPEYVQTREDKILQYLVSDIVNKDIISRYRIRDIETFREIVKYIISNFSNPMTYNSVKKTFNIGSIHTAKDYLSYLEESYLSFYISSYSSSLKKLNKMPKKIYLIDTGISNIIKHPKMLDIGRTEENIVFLKLNEMYDDIHYWKDRYGKEIDFVITNKKGKKCLIQVCHNLENENTHNREKQALVSGAEYFKLKKGIIVNDSIDQEIKYKNITISYIPFWKFLLKKSIN